MKYAILAIALAVALAAGLTGGAAIAQGSYTQFWSNVQMMYSLIVENDITVRDDLTVDDDTTLTDDLTLGGLLINSGTAIAVTNGSYITPTSMVQELTAAAAAGTSNLAAGADGQLLVLYNSSANAITITDTGTLKLSSNLVLGQYDSAVLVSDGTNWMEAGASDN